MPPQPIDEQTPLLDPEAQVAADSERPVPPQEKRTRTWWTTAWHTILAALGVVALLLFIKGVIDTDDVDVSVPQLQSPRLSGEVHRELTTRI